MNPGAQPPKSAALGFFSSPAMVPYLCPSPTQVVHRVGGHLCKGVLPAILPSLLLEVTSEGHGEA